MSLELVSRSRDEKIGRTVSHYRVLRMIGAGGMADVYEAEDLSLGRRVALKFLSSRHVPSRQAMHRLEREARAASALNHPHICTIFDIGEHEGAPFIAMERLEGETLRSRLGRGPLDEPTLLAIAIQIADALEAAHRAHVVHRDVSPSNVFLTPDGHAKLLDFGLATEDLPQKRARPWPRAEEAATTTEESLLTSPGAVVGTTAYMSPEQVRGEPLGHRTDLFSFGAVLYEMATGRRPFVGKTSALIFDAILHATPPPPASVNPAVSAGLQAIVVKALEKDRDLRYQSGADLRVDLERVRRGQDPAPDPWPRRRRRSLQVLGLAALVAGLAFGVRACDHRIPEAAERQVTSGSGVEGDPSVSPDGRTIAFTSDEAGSKDIWIVDVKGGPAQRLTTSDASDSQPAWFPDGRSLAFSSDRRTRTQHDIWRAPILDGRAATLLVPDGESPAISPDGAMVAFVTTNASDYTRIAVAPVANPSQARVLTADRDGRWNHNEPTWSPDGKRICYAAWDGLWVVPADGGGARRLTSEESDQHPSWSPDGRHVYFVSYVDRDAAIWRVTVSTGRRTRVTRGSGVELSPDVSRDGHVLAFASESGNSDLVAFNLADRREAARFGTGKDDYWPSVGPGGREVYFAANRWGLHDIWRQLLQDGRPVGMPERVFEQTGDKSYPAVSPDGRWLAYYRLERTRPERQSRDVWLVSTSGGAPAPVATAGDSFHPAWSPDSSTLVYGSERSGAQALWTQRVVEGKLAGPPRSITPGWSHFTLFPAWSPDGSTVAFLTTHGRSNVDDLALVPAAGGPPRMVTSGADVGCVRWDPRTGYLLVAARWGGDEYELRSIRPDGSPVADDRLPLRLGREPESAKFDLSPDGRFVVSAQGKLAGHVWVMETRSRTF